MARIGDILVAMKACTAAEVRAGLQTQAIFGGRIGTNLLELGIIDENQLAAALARAHGIPCIAGEVVPEDGAVESLPLALAERFGVVPIHVDERRLRVLVSDPRDLSKLDDLAFATGKTIEPILAPEARLWAALRRFYGIERRLRGLEFPDDLESAAIARGGHGALAQDAPGGGWRRALSPREAVRIVETIADPIVLSSLIVRAAASVVPRAAFLKGRPGRAVVWLGAGDLATDVRGVEIPLDHDDSFGAAMELRAPVLFPVRRTPGTSAFFEALGPPPPMNALLVPVLLRGRAVALVYADAGPGATLREEAAELITLVAAVNQRLAQIAPVSQ